MMSRKAKLYIAFFAVLVIGFYLVVRKWLVREDPISTVQPFSFVTQDGNRFTDKDIEGKVYVSEFFFTHCPGICPMMNANMRKVYDRFKDRDGFLILSHTCDPDRDSVQQLKKYADSMMVNTAKWVFLTGRKDSLYTAARISYAIDDPANNLRSIDEDFLHTQFWALVNRKGKVIRIYDGLKPSEVNNLIADIDDMLKD